MRKLWALVFICLSAGLYAQSVVNVQPEQCRWHAGDSPSWAAPEFNDSGWQRLTGTVLPQVAHLWVRCHVPMDGLRGVSKPAMLVYASGAYELFSEGVSAGRAGNLNSGDYSQETARTYPLTLSRSASSPASLAFRITLRPRGETGGSFFALELGDDSALRADKAQSIVENVRPLLLYVVLYCVVGIVGAVQLGLFWYDRSRLDLLWLSLYCIFVAMLRVNTLAWAAQVDFPGRLYDAVYVVGNLAFIFQTMFAFALARKRIPWFVWALYPLSQTMILLVAAEFASPLGLAWRLNAFYPLARHIGLVAWTLMTLAPFVAFWPWNRLAPRLRPIAICCLLWSLCDFVYFLVQTVVSDFLHHTELYRRQSIVLFEARAFISGITVLMILALLFRDQRRITEERAVLVGELQAAREIQKMLAPDKLPCAPGLSVRVAFRPVREVGGDFYLCRVLADGRQRILLGDVSGKGTAAAMTAALLLGGAEDHESLAPGELLSHLDRVLRESNVGGFATCLCADFDADGNVTLANAGHLPPYRAGEELPTASALPLGLAGTDKRSYEEIAFALEPGDTLTFLSDGVVEARSATGELFGFDRARGISTEPAEEIAQTAQRFGQEDDITVLTLTFAPVGVAVA